MEPNETPQNNQESTLEAVNAKTETNNAEGLLQAADSSDVSKMPIAKRAAKIRHLTRLGMNGTEICHKLGITYSQYRHAVTWSTQKAWSSNAVAFHRYYMSVQSSLEQLEMDMIAARNGSQEITKKGEVVTVIDHRAIAAFHKIRLDAWNSAYEMALKLGILDREAIKLQAEGKVEVSFGEENAVPWFVKRALPASAERVQ